MKNTTTLSLALLLPLLGDASVSCSDDRLADRIGRDRDQLRIAAQAICPISGDELGEHGPPLKVAVGELKEVMFVCSKDCLQRPIDPKHWATIHANIARAQAQCPVMRKPLPKRPKWTIVNGQIVYVCCPPCLDLVAKDPDLYLPRIDASYAASLQTKPTDP